MSLGERRGGGRGQTMPGLGSQTGAFKLYAEGIAGKSFK